MKKIISGLLLLLTLVLVLPVNAAPVNLGFNSNGLTGWQFSPNFGTPSPTGYSNASGGSGTVSSMSNFNDGGNNWTITPYTGNYMASLQPCGYCSTDPSYSQMTTALGLNSTSLSSIQNFLNSHNAGGATNPTDAAWMNYNGLNLTAGTTFTVAWNFVATDYVPWNDTSITTLVATSGGGLATINNTLGQYSIIGAINPGAGNYSTNSYGSTGWEVATYTINVTGTYQLGFGSFNLGDEVNSPILLVSGTQGTTLLNGSNFSPVQPNPGSNSPPPPTAPTVTGTSTVNQTSTVIIGNQVVTVTTPVTTTTYSNGTTSTSNGTATQTVLSTNTITGAKFGPSQVADTQWNVSACTQTSTCQIYSTSPGVTYETGSPTTIAAGQYITLIPNTGSNSSTYPWEMILVNSDGTFTVLGIGKILVQGVDSNGHIFIFFSNANYNGTLLSGNLGLSGQGVTFTGTADPSVSATNSLASNMSTSVLAPGQTGGTFNNTPTVVSTVTSDQYSTTTVGNTTYTYVTSVTTTTYSDGSVTVTDGSTTLYSTTTTSNETTVTTTTGNSSSFTNSGSLANVNINGSNLDNDGYTVNGSTTPSTTTTTITLVTTTTYSDGSTTTTDSPGSSVSVTTYSYNVTATIDTNNQINPYSGTNTNAIYINQQSGSSDNVTIKQSGKTDLVALYISGNTNNITAYQGYDVNTLNVATESSTVSNNDLMSLSVIGNSNILNGQQTGNSNNATISVTGNNNNSSVIQAGNNNQSFNLINGSWNSLTAIQVGSYNLSSINLYGNNNVAAVTQTGNNNSSALNLTNAGGANNVSVSQTGNGYSYSLTQTCYVSTGCNVTITQHQ